MTQASKPSATAFLELGFRPLYLGACIWAAVSIALWVFAPQVLGAPLSGVGWHIHEMLWGFVATVAVGFLLTASATWTGHNPLKGPALGGVAALWLVARAGYLFGGREGFLVAAAVELAFFLISAACLLRVVVKGNSRRNLGLPILLAGLAAADAAFLWAVWSGSPALALQGFRMGLLCMALIALLIARRVIPFFSMRMVPGLVIPMQLRSGLWQMALGGIAIACGLVGQDKAMSVALTAVGLLALWQLVSWNPLAVLHKPMLWILYLGYAALAAGLLLAAAYYAGLASGPLARPATYAHMIGVGGFGVLIIGMVTRTALGHLGRPLQLDHSMVVSYWLMVAAWLLRMAALWPSGSSAWLLQAAALCWIAVFTLYVGRFAPMLLRPRPALVAMPAIQPAAASRPLKA